ncbi:MAG: hypothetical protein PHE18_06380 [Candidatus Omnitrophica bacterium]|nr:hypothetical protein [Candidatus Omnitrophota bacterium]MDD5553484.1 hypothetical protein [Candidatus Omnitrophota bacterium]
MKTADLDCEYYIRKTAEFRNGIFHQIAARDPGQLWLTASLEDVKKVIVILSASRSGSSLLSAVLKKMPSAYSLSGESVPFYKLNGFSSDAFLSDGIPDSAIRQGNISGLSRDLLSDFSLPAEGNRLIKEESALIRYIDELALRFSLQWPGADFSYNEFSRLTLKAYEAYAKTRSVFSPEDFYLELILWLRQEYKAINPYYYDIPPEAVRERFPGLELPSGPPHDTLTIEEPPFILLSPREKVTKKDLSAKTLLLKTSADCYRMPFLETIFPRADIRVVYLTRNPLGCVNGLYDGWLHRGFFSHNLSAILKDRGQILDISGYSGLNEWGRRWWKYDLPAGWRDYAQKSLEEVCAFQWYSANYESGEYLRKSGRRCCRVKYENMIAGIDSITGEFDKIMDFFGPGAGRVTDLGLHKLPVVQATEPPRIYRWKTREDMLLPLLDDHKTADMAKELGYNKNNVEEWF